MIWFYILFVSSFNWLNSIAAVDTNGPANSDRKLGQGLSVLRSLQQDVSMLKSQHAITLSHLTLTLSREADLQNKIVVVQNDIKREKAFRLNLERELGQLKYSSCCKNLQRDLWKEIAQIKTDLYAKRVVSVSNIKNTMTTNSVPKNPRKVYFSSTVNKDINKIWTSREKIIFTKVLSNVGVGYNATTGIFTAPRNGGYLFLCFLASHSNEIKASVVVNGTPKVGVPAIARSGPTGYGAAGNAVILQLAKDDRVWIEHISGGYLWSHPRFPYSTFSGYLVE